MNPPQERMDICSHLGELRSRLLRICACIFVCTGIALFWNRYFLESLLALSNGYQFILYAPQAMAVQSVKLAVLVGVCISMPVILLQIWGFIRPALLPKEKGLLRGLLWFGSILFFMGCLFAYKMIIPFTLRFFLSLDMPDAMQTYVSIDAYLSFVCTMLLVFGILFEVPIVILLLDVTGIVTAQQICALRKYIIVLCMITAGIITPPDVFSLIITALPMLLLFEIGILIAKFYEKVKRSFIKSYDRYEKANHTP